MSGTHHKPAPHARGRRVTTCIAALIAGGCGGVVAALAQSAGFALVGLQSVAIGALVGLLLVGSTATLGLRRPRWLHALLAAVVALVIQHVWLYAAAMDQRQQAVAKQPAVELFRPGWADQSFLDYMRSEATPRAVALWTLDACLLTATAVVMVGYSGKSVSAGEE